MKFTGDFPAKTDAKGRVFMPAALRKMVEAEGEQRFVLRNDIYQPCLVLYPESVWDATLNDLRSRLNPWNKQHQAVMRQFAMDAEPIELDSNGRLLLSKRKIEYAGIKADVRFVAVDDKIEIWGRERLDEVMSESADLGETISNFLG